MLSWNLDRLAYLGHGLPLVLVDGKSLARLDCVEGRGYWMSRLFLGTWILAKDMRYIFPENIFMLSSHAERDLKGIDYTLHYAAYRDQQMMMESMKPVHNGRSQSVLAGCVALDT